MVTDSTFAKARPAKVEPENVIADPASMVPTKSVLTNVAAVPSCQYTLHALPPLAMTTLLRNAGVAPPMGVMLVSPLKTQTPLLSPPPLAVKSSVNWPVNSPTPLMQ